MKINDLNNDIRPLKNIEKHSENILTLYGTLVFVGLITLLVLIFKLYLKIRKCKTSKRAVIYELEDVIVKPKTKPRKPKTETPNSSEAQTEPNLTRK